MTVGAAVAVTQIPTAGTSSDTASSPTVDTNARERAAEDTSRSADRQTDLTDDVTNQQAAAATAAEEKERARAAAEEAARQRAAEEEARKKAEQEAARQRAAEEEARKKAEQEAARQKAAEEEAARERAEERERAQERERAREEAADRAARAEEEANTWVAPLDDYRISAGFGSSGQYWSSTHTGLDFAATMGSDVGAVAAGTVTDVGWDGPYGNKVEVRHADGTVTWYCHLSQASAGVGTEVGPGDTIGHVGSTGNSTGPHLHLEVHPGGGAAVDPRNWLAERGVDL